MVYCGLKIPASEMLVDVPQLAMLDMLLCLMFVTRSPSARCARVAKVDISDLDITEMK
jgi:hypothetical protein